MRLPVLMIIVCYFFLLLTDYIIFQDLKGHRNKWWKRCFGIFTILIFTLLTVAVCMPKRNVSTDITATMWILYMVLTVELSQIVYSIFSIIGRIPQLFKRRKWKLFSMLGTWIGGLVFILMWYGTLWGRFGIDTNHVEIESDKLPESFDGYRIAQISDLHLGTWGNDTSFVSKLVDSVMSQKPDLIVFTGDAVNRTSQEFQPFIPVLSRLSAPDGVYSILGNHDYGDYVRWENEGLKKENLNKLKEYETKVGWKLMENNHISIFNEKGDSIVLIGVGNWGEPPFSQYGNLPEAYPKELHHDKNFKILLSHNPKHWEEIVSKETNIDLTLAGHTHAMQMMIQAGDWKWSPAKLKYNQWSGLYMRRNPYGEESSVYVNIGAGEVGLPMRIGATPEITIFTLQRSK